MLAVATASVGHLPSYGCENRCCHPPYDHKESQVFYGRGTWGLELDIADFDEGEILDIDAVFRDPVDPQSFSIYIGCGGCALTDPVIAPRVTFDAYETPVLEPFSHTRYYSIFPESERKYNTSLLATCSSRHFTIRILDHGRPDGSPLVWAPVIGLSEAETTSFHSLIRFPLFLWRNHGSAWNEIFWSYPLFLCVGAPLLVFGTWMLCTLCFTIPNPKGSREIAYLLSLVAFTAAFLENLVHTVYAQWGIPVDGALATALLINIFTNGLGVAFCIIFWSASDFAHKVKGSNQLANADCCRACTRGCWQCCGAGSWWVGEAATALFLVIAFGAGYYFGPYFLFVAAIARAQELGVIPQLCPCIPWIRPDFDTEESMPMKQANEAASSEELQAQNVRKELPVLLITPGD